MKLLTANITVFTRDAQGNSVPNEIRAEVPGPIRVGDPDWTHRAAKAIALSISEHFDTQGN